VVTGLAICEPTPSCHSRYYNDKLPQRLKGLQKKLPGLVCTIYDAYGIYKKMFDNAKRNGKQKKQNLRLLLSC